MTFTQEIEQHNKLIKDLKAENRLLGERCNQLLKDKGDLTDEIADLKANCDLAIEGRDIKIKELEQKLEQTENDLADYQFNYPTIKELTEGTCFAHLKSLEQENAELKEEVKALEKTDNININHCMKVNGQLIKAKEIIKNILNVCCSNCTNPHCVDCKHRKIVLKAEQFLKGENIILEDAQAGNSPFDADKVFKKEMKAYPEEK